MGSGSSVKELCDHLENISGFRIQDQNISVPGHMEFFSRHFTVKIPN